MNDERKAIVLEFARVCASVVIDHNLYRHLFEQDERRLKLYDEIAPLTFHDLSDIVGQHVLLQFAKLTDHATTGRHPNLTTNYILETLPWDEEVRAKLTNVNRRLMAFRAYIAEARSKGSRILTFMRRWSAWNVWEDFRKAQIGSLCATCRNL